MSDLTEVTNDDDMLKFAQQLRLDIVNANRANLTDSDSVNHITKALKDMDSQILTRRRLEIDQDSADNEKAIAQGVLQLTDQIRRNAGGNPFRRKGQSVELDENQMPKFDIDSGELEAEHTGESFKEFSNRMDEDE